MRYYTILILTFFLSAGLLDTANAQQSIEIANIEYHHEFIPNSNAKIHDIQAHITVPILHNDRYSLAAFPVYNQTYLGNLGFGLPSHMVRSVDLPFIFQYQLSDHRAIGAIISPGIHSDFKDITGEDWALVAAIFISNTQNPRFQFKYGLLFSRQVTGMLLIPAIMFYWHPTERITIDNLDVVAPEFSYKISKNLSAGAFLRYRGGTYKLSENFQSKVIQDTRYKIAPYIDYNLWGNFILRGAVGYTFSGNVKLFDDVDAGSTWFGVNDKNTLKEMQFSGWFIKVGLRLAVDFNQ